MITGQIPAGMHEFQNACLHLIVDEVNRLLYSEWTRKPSSEELWEATGTFAHYLHEGSIEFWIQDANRLGEVPIEDMKTAMYKFVPVAAYASLKRLARVTSDEKSVMMFQELVREAKAQYCPGTALEIQQFETYREAAE